ncbi:hypothetical protein HK102_000305 [Quaeritorhiza haematococci]|nr:hypothetical protein HK102_000305 [Quaeritorhiza haematococci]
MCYGFQIIRTWLIFSAYPEETDYSTLAPYMYGTLLLNTSKQAFYPESEEDPYFKHVKEAFDAMQKPFQTNGPPSLTFESANLASCIAMLIPSLSNLVNQERLTWQEIANGQALNNLAIYELVTVLNILQLPGGVDGPRHFREDGHELRPMVVYNANNKDLIEKGILTESLSPVATMVGTIGGYGFAFKDARPVDVINRISFPNGTVPSQPVIIKIGFMWSAKPSYDEFVKFNGVDVNLELLPLQALVDYWNTNNAYYPKNVRMELVYGSHSMDPRKAIAETGRLVEEERVSFLIGDMNTELTAAVGNVLRSFDVLQCSSIADTGAQIGDFGSDSQNFISAQGSLVERGDAAAILLENFRMNQVVVLYEDTPECQSMRLFKY